MRVRIGTTVVTPSFNNLSTNDLGVATMASVAINTGTLVLTGGTETAPFTTGPTGVLDLRAGAYDLGDGVAFTTTNPGVGNPPNGERLTWRVVIFFPWDPERKLFGGEKVYTDVDFSQAATR